MLDWDTIDYIGEELDEAIRNRLSQLQKEFEEEYEIVGGYSVLSSDPNSAIAPEGIEIYFEIKNRQSG